MAILGLALGRYLSGLKGLYSVELPAALYTEIRELVNLCNIGSPTRAILVAANPDPLGIPTTSWDEILKWRTDDDRLFAWARGPREPDSSFRSAVKPFISAQFPGSPTGECTLALLARLSVQELWQQGNRSAVGESYDAFHRTARWVVNVLYQSFEQRGSTPGHHWSDDFLAHWAAVLDQLSQQLSLFAGQLQPRHAWEILRIAGLPIPIKLVEPGNPFLTAPGELTSRDWPKFAQGWQDIVSRYIQPAYQVPVLLSGLDSVVPGAGSTSPWRQLDWTAASDLPREATAPQVGNRIFTAPPSPSILSATIPAYPIAPTPSWWGVTEKDLQNATENLRKKDPLQPDPASNGLLQAFPGNNPGTWILNTAGASIIDQSSSRKWQAEATITGVRLFFREPWKRLLISASPPPDPEPGDAWLNTSDVTISIKGGRILSSSVTTDAGYRLIVSCDIVIDYSASIDRSTSTMIGKWNSSSSIEINAIIKDYMDSAWGPARPVQSRMPIIIPSPFSPTVLLSQANQGSKVQVSPDSSETFIGTGSTSHWQADSTPDLLLKEDDAYDVAIYQGSLEPTTVQPVQDTGVLINESPLIQTESRLWRSQYNLDDGDRISVETSSGRIDVGVVKVRERSSNLSSGLLSAVRGQPAGRRPPAAQERASFLGQYQDRIVDALGRGIGTSPNSLYQYVVSSVENPAVWPRHEGNPSPEFLPSLPLGQGLPGLGKGPSAGLVNRPEWKAFMQALVDVCAAIGLPPGASDFWLSSFDPVSVGAARLKTYLSTHAELVRAARDEESADVVWAAYPFSIFLVEGGKGSAEGSLLAVLISPLHPARLAWTFSVAFVARQGRIGQGLLGFAEGWNIPYTGHTLNSSGQVVPLVAVPLDPGTEQDFAAWSALAVIDHRGQTSLPATAASLPLPWGGRTGINPRVIERALKDYMTVHPHMNSLEVDIRSVSEAPRSHELDDTILRYVASKGLSELESLSGGTRVWDSDARLGAPPTRDALLRSRTEGEQDRPFEWRVYQHGAVPDHTDIAFIENASSDLAITRGSTQGLVGPLPLRRFSPQVIVGQSFEQNYTLMPGDDLLGLSTLLAEIEYNVGDTDQALKLSPRIQALGIGLGARWEVLGTFNIDPALLSAIVASPQAGGQRLLWEWRPSWLSQAKNQGEFARRPYYVVARIPVPLVKALEYRQGFTKAQATQMLAEIGYRGIGLASLYAQGGSQEGAAAGFFYALSLLLPTKNHQLPAAWTISNDANPVLYGLLPIDPIEAIIEELTGNPLKRRADLLLLRITQRSNGSTHICMLPIEVKHHGNPQLPEQLPVGTNEELRRAREQLRETAQFLQDLNQALYFDPTSNPAICYAKRLAFAVLVDLAMSFAPMPPSAEERGRVLGAIINGSFELGLATPVLLWFAPGSLQVTGSAVIVDPPSINPSTGLPLREVFIDPSATPALWWNGSSVKPDDLETRKVVDEVMTTAWFSCNPGPSIAAVELRDNLAALLFPTPATDNQDPPDHDSEPPPAENDISSAREPALGMLSEVAGNADVEHAPGTMPNPVSSDSIAPDATSSNRMINQVQDEAPSHVESTFEGLQPPAEQDTALRPNEEDVFVHHSASTRNPAIPLEVREQVRQSFNGFVGNKPIIRQLTNDLIRALLERPPYLSKNYLLTGQPSTGKTELARRVARALGLPIVRLDGRSVTSREELFKLINGELRQQHLQVAQVGQQASLPIVEYPALIIFIDEVHLLPRSVQESLLTMLEAADRTVLLSNQVARMNRATFLFATTRASDVDSAFRSRCVNLHLEEYSLGEVAEMLRLKFSHAWPTEVYLELARLGRGVPRISIQLAEDLVTEILVSEQAERTVVEHLEELRQARQIDERGLTTLDRQYLAVLNGQTRPIGEQAVLSLMGTVDKDRILDEIEPFLRRLGYIKLSPQGREITPDGREHLRRHQH